MITLIAIYALVIGLLLVILAFKVRGLGQRIAWGLGIAD